MKERLQKLIASAGLCARRTAEEWIAAGRVCVNGAPGFPGSGAPGVRVYPVGRLDRDSEGLLLFTNDGDLAQRLLHPRHEVDKVYLVTVRGDIRGAAERLMAITLLDGEPIAPAQAAEVSRHEGQAVLRVTIHQGKNRQVRRMCGQIGLHVVRLQRIQEDSLLLGDLPAGKWRYLTDQELQGLKGGEMRECE